MELTLAYEQADTITFSTMISMKRRLPATVLLSALLLAGCAEKQQPSVNLGAEGTLPVDGAQLRYWTVGNGPPVMILHGGPGIGIGYLLSELDAPGFPPEGLRWVAYDQRGSGRSTGAEDPSQINMDRFVEDLEAMRVASGQDRIALMGHSFGGLLAMHYAVKYREHLAAMILIDPDPASRALWSRHEELVEARLTESDRMLMAAISSAEGWETDPVQVENYYLAQFQAYFGNREPSVRLRLGLAQGVYGNFPATALVMRESLGDWDIFSELEGIEVPTLILTGDRSVFPLSAHEMLRSVLPASELVVLPGVGHFPHMEDPEAFATITTAFLASVTNGAGSEGTVSN